MTNARFVSRAAWNTPSPAASAFWKMTSTPRAICASACSFPALTSSQLPTYDVTTVTFGLTDFAPAAKASKLSFTGGSSVPPMVPRTLDLVTDAAMVPAT